MMPRRLLEDITVVLVHSTEKAWLVNDGKTEVWFPKSWGELEKNPDGKSWTLTAEESKLIEKGLV